jgi:spore germination cell wall hydrolase CwlJ-like protein
MHREHWPASFASLWGLMPIALLGASLAGCAALPEQAEAPAEKPPEYAASDKDCLVRAMYFEANRSSDDGLLAIGSVVMNRVKSGTFPDTICGVVGQRGQFAAGVLTHPMQKRDQERVERIAEQVLGGRRHPQIANAMYFHVAGLRFHYANMHYVLVAGGNAFYERRPSLRHRAHGADIASAPPVAPVEASATP